MARVLILGLGYLGHHLAQKLDALGHEVIGLKRQDTITSYPLITHDLCQKPISLPKADYVCYMLSAESRTPEAYHNAYIKALKNALQGLKTQRFIYISSTGVYAHNQGQWIDETCDARPQHFTGKLLLEGENLVQSHPIDSVILRASGIYGPGRTRLLDQIRSGQASWHDPDHFTNRIHVEDLSGMIHHIMMLDDPKTIYHASDDQPILYNTLLEKVCSKLDQPTPSQKISFKSANKKISNQAIRESGYTLSYPDALSGYASLIEQGH